MSEPQQTASFGFHDVPEGEKARLVGEVFSSVAGKYDLMNDLMSLRVHRLWKDAMINWLAPRPGWRALDVAGGTGDIAFRMADRGAGVTVCDINPDMLAEGRKRAEAKGRADIAWTAGDAEALPFAGASFDAYTIAFGIRNVTHIEKALSEACRVLKPGGRFLCLEFSRCDVPGVRALYDAYSFRLLPKLGYVVTGDEASYRYLVESIRKFPPQEKFAAMIADAGLGQVKYRDLTFGIAALHSAWKI
jgi:demethylmenaquinone methyltransferase / 2-methoxy-6-polyprenyl-1,4-benzoquinol methylase